MNEPAQLAKYKATGSVLLISVTSFGLLQGLVLPILSIIKQDLHTTQANATWVLTAFLLSASIATPILGRIGDQVGRKRLLVITLLALSLGCILAGIAHSIEILIVARVIQGLGGAVVPLSFGIVRDVYPPARVASGVGLLAAMAAAGAGAGIIIAGPIIDQLNYHWLFWLLLVITSLAAILAWRVIPESRERTGGRIGIPAAVLLSTWLVALLLALSKGASWGWGSEKVIALFGVALVTCTTWIIVELKSQEPLVDMQMMKLTAVWTNNVVAFLLGVGMFSVFTFLPEFVETPTSTGYGFGASVIQAGLFLLPLSLSMFLVGIMAGRITSAIGSKSAVILGLIVAGCGYTWLTIAHSHRWDIYVVNALLGGSFGLAYSAMSNLIVHAVPHSQTGVASGMNANIRTIGGAIGAAVVSSILASSVLRDGYPTEAQYKIAFAFLAISTVLAIVAAVFIPKGTTESARSDRGPLLSNAELAILASAPIVEE